MSIGPDDVSVKPLVLLDPAPQLTSRIFAPDCWAKLNQRFTVVDCGGDPGRLDELLPRAFAVVGQPDLSAERLNRADRLRVIMNVEGNFYPNVDYPTAFARGVRVLGSGPAYAQAVAEYALGLAIDLARGISREDRAFREGRERYLGEGNSDAILLQGSDIGFVGFGNLGRALRPLLAPFRPRLRVYDPWLPDAVLREAGLEPAKLDEVLGGSQFVFVLAAVTGDNQHLLDGPTLDLVRPGARLVLVSRAAMIDYDALVDRIERGDFLAAVDVWPDEPMPAEHRSRRLEGLVLSAHRAGGIPAAFAQIGELVLDDLDLMVRGLPPVRMQAAAPELVGRYRNKPAA